MYTMLPMKETSQNPLVRVRHTTRRKLKILAVYYNQTMQDLLERLAAAELQRLEDEGKLTLSPDEKKGQ